MSKDIRHFVGWIAVTLLWMMPFATVAQTQYAFRYVDAENGTFGADGRSWGENAKNNLQTAIDEVYEEIRNQPGTLGYVFVAQGTYVPTRRSTDEADGSLFNTSFRIPERVYVFGGFKGDEKPDDGKGEETLPGRRLMTNDMTLDEDEALIDRDNIDNSVRRWNFKHKTILSGNHSLVPSTFTYDTTRGRYSTTFPLNSYHVVWFGTNGTISIDKADYPGLSDDEFEKMRGHYRGLTAEACVDGCTIREGYASNRNYNSHEHTGYGGGVYMVKNSLLRNCIVENCVANMRGGGVYMDGGGEVDRCYIHTCQATGVGVVQGYGGAVCIDYDGAVKHSHIIQSAARIGAGLAICHVPGEYPETSAKKNDPVFLNEYKDNTDNVATHYDPYCVATVIANNTSNAEGGGVYLDEGGTLNHCTVVKNRCVGPDVVYYGRRHGRTGGIYVRSAGTVYNSVAWGNEDVNQNRVQFASFREATASDAERIAIYHSAFSFHDITNWANATKDEVLSLTTTNVPADGTLDGNYPAFRNVTRNAGIQYDESTLTINPDATDGGQPYQKVYNWHPQAVSALRLKAVQVSNAVQGITSEVIHAHTEVDVVGRHFEAVSSIGALAHSYRTIEHALVRSQEENETDVLLPTIFVDPNRKVVGETNNAEAGTVGYLDSEAVGMSWTLPAGNLPDAIMYFKQFQITDATSTDYLKYDIDGTIYNNVQILVKTGQLSVAGTGSYLANSVRTASIRPVSNMRLYGGFASTFADTATVGRNQRQSPTRITADVINGGYANNSAHVFSLVNCRNVIIDGFRIYYGNANLTEEEQLNTRVISYGGGVMVSNYNATDRIDMTGNILRNCVIANCSSPEGGAIYVNGEYEKADGNLTHAELSIVNTIIRNCTTSDVDDAISEYGGVVVANGNAVIHMDHCDILNNKGYPLETRSVEGNVPAGQYKEGRIDIHNSIIYANARVEEDNRNVLGNDDDRQALIFKKSSADITITGSYVFTDAIKAGNETEYWPKGFDATCRAFLLYNSSDATTYPRFKNPSRNIGHNEDADKPLYGGTVDYEPMNTNPIVNAAGAAVPTSIRFAKPTSYSSPDLDAGSQPRTRGGAPDIGAIEGSGLPAAGTVLYVTPDGAGRRDGSSWANAIAGNTVYCLDTIPGPGLASGDQMDTESGRVLDADGNPVLTSDEKYSGGFGRVWFTERKKGFTQTTTITQIWDVEKNVYDDGEKAGDEDIVSETEMPSQSTTVSTVGTADPEFKAGYDYDPRYPYGEISGQSRSFWRANPYHSGTDWNNAADYADLSAFIDSVNKKGFIKNERRERYVSGLQYAVERAAAYNTGAVGRKEGVDSVQVWISNGKYTDYKGYIMRNKTTVMGSFPAVRDGMIYTPGLTERQALMSDVISIPKALVAENLEAKDYETILQISDQDPKALDDDNIPFFDKSAVKFWDNDYVQEEQTLTTHYEYKNNVKVNHWRLSPSDVTSIYVHNPSFANTSRAFSIVDDNTTKLWVFGSEEAGKNRWYLSHPNPVGDYENYIANIDPKNNTGKKIYDPETDEQLTGADANYTTNWMNITNGSLTGTSLWQTIPNLPKGLYSLEIDMAGGYRNKFSTKDRTNIYFHILDADDKDCVDPVELKTIGSSTNNDNTDTNRGMAYRYRFDFEQKADGPITFKIEVKDGVRNTKTANATYGTEDGGDPYPIPCQYRYNGANCTGDEWGGNNPNRREFWISHLVLGRKTQDYILVSTENKTEDREVGTPAPDEIKKETVYTAKTERTTLRKRVLTMPDVTVPTYGGGGVGNPTGSNMGKFGDDLSHTDRVPEGNPARDLRTATTKTKESDPNYQGYTNVFWNGFTIRHGFIYDETMAHGGGSGACIYEGAHLQNCVIYDNVSAAGHIKGGGLFCDGATSTIENCFALENVSTFGSGNLQQNQVFAAGMFMYEGTCFNSLFAKNYSYGSSGGVGFCVGRFYNNTIAYNTCNLTEDMTYGAGAPEGKSPGETVNVYMGGGISQATASNPNLFVANTIIYGNNGAAIRDRNTGANAINPFIHCFIQSEEYISSSNETSQKNILNWTEEDKTHFGIGNTFLNGVAATQENSPFEADKDYFGKARDTNDFRLSSTNSLCVNFGTDDFSGNFYTALKRKRTDWKENDATIRSQFVYQQVEKAELPLQDVVFADRIQDCQIDIGAYEYDGAKDIRPDLREDGKAIFYVSQNGAGGLATADSPENAACASKLQKVLDAAGRWKYAAYWLDDEKNITNFTLDELKAELTEQGVGATNENIASLKDRTVIVKLAGDTHDTGFKYSPTRTTDTDPNSTEENLLEYSFIVPRGVQLWGGYTTDEVEKTDGSGEKLPAFSDESRDPLGYPTYLSGIVHNTATGTDGNTFHVVTFTENLFSTSEKLYLDDDDNQQTGQLSVFTDEKDRAVLDGLFITDGQASGTDEPNRLGGAAVVTGYAHVRNCVVTGNTAQNFGGGLYLQPGALVSGSIIKDNTAKQGGGLYVAKNRNKLDSETDEQYMQAQPNVHLFTTTVINNSATQTGGGMFYTTDRPNIVATSSVFWKNQANDLANVAGNIEAQTYAGLNEGSVYPFNYCGIESRRVSGVNNLSLPVADGEGVRWNHRDRYEDGSLDGTIRYVPITLSSVLARAGMTYAAYKSAMALYPTLLFDDIARLQRMEQTETDHITMSAIGGTNQVERVRKDNSFIDMGARVVNKSYAVAVDPDNIMRRLFVAKTENLPDPQSLEYLQENTNTDALSSMYRQMGSTFANPFHRLGDAFDYIKEVRTKLDDFRNTRFEVFVSEGEFYPFRDAYGQQGDARTNTFVVPEGVTVVGGVQVDAVTTGHNYCQEGYGETGSGIISVETSSGQTVTLNQESTQTIRNDRTRYDYNGNNVYEPWEMKTLSKLMGNAVDANSEGTTNVYHVITCMADEEQVGQLPAIYSDEACTTEVTALTSADLKGTTDQNQTKLLENIKLESQQSMDRRTIILDGLQITGGHANDIQESHAEIMDLATLVQQDGESDDDFAERKAEAGRQNATQLTYFRGGGILVEGNWNQDFLEQGTLPEVLGVARRDIPLMVVNCEFQNNQAGNGGAIYSNGTLYVVGSHFTQNLAMGPQTLNDQKFIPWTAGGAIATNYGCNVFNTLFDNNEARRGRYAILSYADNPRNTSGILNADARQGSGGVISSSETSIVRMANCNLVKNKAMQFPAIYNFYDNKRRNDNPSRYGAGRHYAVNTVFWGNDVFPDVKELPMALAAPLDDGVEDLRKRYHVANFGPGLDQEVLYFCAYEKATGRQATMPSHDSDRRSQKKTVADIASLKDGSFFATNFTQYNNNQLINSVNTAADGPSFTQPSTIVGIDGYMQNADWLVSRLNALIDNGWSYLEQDVTQPDARSALLDTRFYNADKTATYDHDASNTKADGLSGSGFYNTFSKDVYGRFRAIGFSDLMPIADEKYMDYLREGESSLSNMRRISTHPKIGQTDVFIDIGIYEYQYVQLTSLGNETDVIWVGPSSRGRGDGTTAQNCTNDLQEAIETLLLSRNGHDKMIKLIGGSKGSPSEFSPMNTTGASNKLAFFIKVPEVDDGVTNPSTNADEHLGIKSITIRGGYSADTPNANDGESLRNVEDHPVLLKMSRLTGYTNEQYDHLFVVENAQQKETFGNFINQRNTEFVDEAVPIVVEGLTFENTMAVKHSALAQGAAGFYYQQQNYKADINAATTGRLQPARDFERDDDGRIKTADNQYLTRLKTDTRLPKLIIKDCIFRQSGGDDGVTAVAIEDGGGEAIIANSLFHSNTGSPLEATNTKVVNCTFAMNGGHLRLSETTENYADGTSGTFTSQLHNSIIWKDDQANAMTTQYEGIASDPVKMTYNALTGETNAAEDSNNHNISLSDVNDDVFLGPNFAAPENADPSERDFHVNISNRVINRASKDKYIELVPYYETRPAYRFNNLDAWSATNLNSNYTDIGAAGQYAIERDVKRIVDDREVIDQTYWFHSVQRGMQSSLTDELLIKKADTSLDYTETELANNARLLGTHMERGAYESEAAVRRVLYVSGEGGHTKRDGTSWLNAYAIDRLQDAVNVASIYSMTNDGERAYVFVKTDNVTAPAVKMRDGVSVYGSLRQAYLGEALEDRDYDGDEYTNYSDNEVERYVREVEADRLGIASENAPATKIAGIGTDATSDGYAFNTGFLLDGFYITAPTAQATPVVTLNKPKTAVKGCVVTANTVATQPVAYISQGLLYNTLVHSNTTDDGVPVVSVGSNGYVLNCTVVGTDGQTTIGGQTSTDHVQNTIAVTDGPATWAPMFAPYQRPTDKHGNTAYTPADHVTDWQPYWYQLHEQSTHIDGAIDDALGADGGNAIAQAFPAYVDFSHDRDVLGNPRRLGARADNGCYETWRVTADVYATNATNVGRHVIGDDTNADYYASYTSNYGGHRYPHAGSVTYVMNGGSLCLDDTKVVRRIDNADTETPRFTGTGALRPGYLLVQDGGSLYGNGNTVQAQYVAVERTIGARDLVSLPFDYDMSQGKPYTPAVADGAMTQTEVGATAYTYDGEARAAWNYSFSQDDSQCWTAASDAPIAANTGWLIEKDSEAVAVRLTAWAPTGNTYVYEEDGTDKTVDLTQHDSRTTDSDSHPRFTNMENMGWNLRGLPYLVSNYATHAIDDDGLYDGDSQDYQMNVPHVIYATLSADDAAHGQFYTTQSWADGAALSLGRGFFTQTAVIGDGATETLVFRLPRKVSATAPARPLLAFASDRDGTADVIELRPTPTATDLPAYQPGLDGLKWRSLLDGMPMLHATSVDGTPLSLMAAAPVECEIPLAIVATDDGPYTFALPEPEAFDSCDVVWLIDHEAHTSADLRQTPYSVALSAGEDRQRFTLKIGGPRPYMGVDATRCAIYTVGDMLHIDRLTEGDEIFVYTPAGIQVAHATATSAHYEHRLRPGVYHVRAANVGKTVMTTASHR